MHTSSSPKFGGHMLPLQKRDKVLRLALGTLWKLVKTGYLHPTKVITRATSLVPFGGLPVTGLNRRPYFAGCSAMQASGFCPPTASARGPCARTHEPTRIGLPPGAFGARSRRSASAASTHGKSEHRAFPLLLPVR